MATATMMKRFYQEDKETLWEQDLYDELYTNAVDGSRGLYKSADGKYFFAEVHRNGFTYNGHDELRILPEDVVKDALQYKDPIYKLSIDGWFL